MIEKRHPTAVEMADDVVAVNRLFVQRGWTDGLPIIPPTTDRVDRMLAATPLAGDHILGEVPPGRGLATLEQVAINTVMAGCPPEAFPVIVAAVEAILEPAFNLYGIQTTTNPVAPIVMVNGPIRHRLGIHSGTGCLGPGPWVNAAIGRALRLIMLNIGNARPGEMDRATHGQPAKFGLCFAENEEDSPWPPFAGRPGGIDDVVTVFGIAGTVNLIDFASQTAEGLLKTLVDALPFVGSNDVYFEGQPLVVLSPEHAHLLHRGGFERAELAEYLYERTWIPIDDFSKENVEVLLRVYRSASIDEEHSPAAVRMVADPSRFLFVVAGGPGPHMTYMPGYGETRFISKPIRT
jgi:hypothetical protein